MTTWTQQQADELRALEATFPVKQFRACVGSGARDGTGVCMCGAIYGTDVDCIVAEIPVQGGEDRWGDLAPSREGQMQTMVYIAAALNAVRPMLDEIERVEAMRTMLDNRDREIERLEEDVQHLRGEVCRRGEQLTEARAFDSERAPPWKNEP